MCPSLRDSAESRGKLPVRFRKGNHPEAKASSLVKPSMPKDSTQLQNSSASKAPQRLFKQVKMMAPKKKHVLYFVSKETNRDIQRKKNMFVGDEVL